MAQEETGANPLSGVVFETRDVPTMYTNHASPSISFSDIRVYFAEIAPKELAATQTTNAIRNEALLTPRLCVVMAPEFAKALAHSINLAVEKYESLFGKLRTPPTAEELNAKLPPKGAQP